MKGETRDQEISLKREDICVFIIFEPVGPPRLVLGIEIHEAARVCGKLHFGMVGCFL